MSDEPKILSLVERLPADDEFTAADIAAKLGERTLVGWAFIGVLADGAVTTAWDGVNLVALMGGMEILRARLTRTIE